MRLYVAGAGRLGSLLALAWQGAGHDIVAVAGRGRDGPRRLCRALARAGAASPAVYQLGVDDLSALRQADAGLLAVPDDALAGVARQLAGSGAVQAGQVVLHPSGAHPAAVLEPIRRAGAHVASLHPLLSVARPPANLRAARAALRGAVMAWEGDEATWPVAQRLATDAGCPVWRLAAGGKALYHLAAVCCSNYLVALAAGGVHLLSAAGVPPEEALRGLLPLLRSTLRNLEQEGVPQALTGPIERGDAGTVARHLEALSRLSRSETGEGHPVPLPVAVREAYRALGRLTLAVAAEKDDLYAQARRGRRQSREESTRRAERQAGREAIARLLEGP